MKKFYLFLMIIIGGVQFSYGQWTTSGSNIYNSNTGNVGIGTTTPQGKLHVYDATAGGVVIRAGGLGGTGFTLLGDGYSGTQTNLNLGLGYSNLKGVLSYGVNVSGTTGDTYLSSQDQFSTSRWAITMGGAASPNWNLLYAPTTTTTAGTAISMSTAMSVNTSGNVGIGTTSPAKTLDIAGTLGVSNLVTSTLGSGEVFRNLSGDTNPLTFRLKNTGNDFYIGTEGATGGAFFTGSLPYSSVIYSATPIQNIVGGVAATIIQGNGNFGVGTTDTHGYKFAVNGSAIATSMTVQLYTNWPDDVFKKDYRLPALADVKNYIYANHRLPDIPSGQEIAKKGLDLGEMNRLLTKKVEELTLYVIEEDVKEKRQEIVNSQLEDKLKVQQDEINELNQKMNKLLNKH